MNTYFDPNSICFGFNRQTDEESLQHFIRAFAQPELLEALVPRMTDAEISQLLDDLSTLMGKHFKEKEYHKLFLGRK
jgi:TorA maturation chaperone TorD